MCKRYAAPRGTSLPTPEISTTISRICFGLQFRPNPIASRTGFLGDSEPHAEGNTALALLDVGSPIGSAAPMSKPSADSKPADSSPPACGVVMPISAIDGCDEHHWSDVKSILFDAIRNAKLHPELVSSADDVGVIQARIIKNLYENPIVICDVSARNANVMFELGMRLAFDKPTVIVIDDKTPFSFDTAPIEHLRYPRDLRHGKIQKFKEDLASKITAVLRSAEDSGYSTFLKHFGSFTAGKLENKELAPSDFILFVTQKLTEIDEKLSRTRRAESYSNNAILDYEWMPHSLNAEKEKSRLANLMMKLDGLENSLLNSEALKKENPNELERIKKLQLEIMDIKEEIAKERGRVGLTLKKVKFG